MAILTWMRRSADLCQPMIEMFAGPSRICTADQLKIGHHRYHSGKTEVMETQEGQVLVSCVIFISHCFTSHPFCSQRVLESRF